MLNSFNVMGRLSSDPELRESKDGGKPFATFSLANNTGKDEVNWINCVCFGKTAEMAKSYLSKGKLIACEGRFLQRKVKDAQGASKEYWSLTVTRFHFAEAKKAPEAVAQGSTEFANEDVPF